MWQSLQWNWRSRKPYNSNDPRNWQSLDRRLRQMLFVPRWTAREQSNGTGICQRQFPRFSPHLSAIIRPRDETWPGQAKYVPLFVPQSLHSSPRLDGANHRGQCLGKLDRGSYFSMQTAEKQVIKSVETSHCNGNLEKNGQEQTKFCRKGKITNKNLTSIELLFQWITVKHYSDVV